MSESTAIVLDLKQYKLEPAKADQIISAFMPMSIRFKQLDDDYQKVISETDITKSVCSVARENRLKYQKIRTDTDKVHKLVKEDLLVQTKAIDELRNVLKKAIQTREEKLDSIEKHFENLEIERKRGIGIQRNAMLRQYDNLDYVGTDGKELGEMSDTVWETYLAGVKANYEAKKAAEIKAEADRVMRELAEAGEREKQRLENIKLKEERDRLEAELAKEKAAKFAEFSEKLQQTIDEVRKPPVIMQDAPDDIKMLKLLEDLRAIQIPNVTNAIHQGHCQIVERNLVLSIDLLQQNYGEDL